MFRGNPFLPLLSIFYVIFIDKNIIFAYIYFYGGDEMTSREIIKRLEEDGWYHVKTTGDHYQMKHPTKPGKVTIVHPAKDLSIGTLRSIEKQSGVRLR